MTLFLKYLCKTCKTSTNKPVVWFKRNSAGYTKGSRLIPFAQCGQCNKEMTCINVQKASPRGGRDLDGAHVYRTGKDREMRPAALNAIAFIADRLPAELKEEKKASRARDVDPPYAPPPAFSPAMRLTPGPKRCECRTVYTDVLAHMKTTTRISIAASNRRLIAGDTASIMGAAINGGTRLSAAAHAGRPDHQTNKYVSSEWCHLQGDCLGGHLLAGNLVSASFAANTEMLAIEHAIMGHTEFEIEVVARCSAPHVAQMIIYTVYAGHTANWTRNIDACNDHFTKEDLDTVQQSISEFVTTNQRR